MEARLFTGWMYDTLTPYPERLEAAHPAMLKAIVAAKNKNDQLDAATIADLLRCNLLPACYMAPAEIRELRRVLCYRNLLVRLSVQMKNKISGLLLECGVATATRPPWRWPANWSPTYWRSIGGKAILR